MKHRILFSIVILAIFTLLNGCSTVAKDGPPPYDVDVSKIPNATPKVEHLSKYGNMPIYKVNGKYYYVMNNSKHYEAEGVASWYGTKFHKHNTSSGEKYDMLAMTAAHRTLPLPTYLEVTNKENGHTIIVKVNDRGPFAEDRLLDLSYAAAKKLGMLGHGTANVKIKAIDPEEFHKKDIYTNDFYIVHNKKYHGIQTIEPQLAKNTNSHVQTINSRLAENTSSSYRRMNEHKKYKPNTMISPYFAETHAAFKAKQFATNKSMYLQVGAFSNKSHAEKLKQQLLPLIASSIQITQHGISSKKLYRVQIGPIKDRIAVARINKQLKSIGLSGKIVV